MNREVAALLAEARSSAQQESKGKLDLVAILGDINHPKTTITRVQVDLSEDAMAKKIP